MKIPTDVLTILDKVACEGNGASLAAVGRLARKDYEAVNKVLVAAGGKWNKKAGVHLFDGLASDALEPIFLTGEITDQKKLMQQFYTPADLAARVIALAGIQPGMLVLEPSAGRGALAVLARDQGATVVPIELDPKNAGHLEASDFNVVNEDFLAQDAAPVFDRVVMNPPFTKGQDVRHVRKALEFLKPGGRLVAIMASSLTYRDGIYQDLRLDLNAAGASITPLHAGAFKESGTLVSTVLVVMDKA